MYICASRTAAGVAALIAATAAPAGTPAITAVVLEGDSISGAGLVTFINNIAVNNSGDWLVEVDTNAAVNDVALIRNGTVIVNEGDGVPAAQPAATLSSFDSITLNNAGESGYNFFLANTGATTNDSGVYFGPGRAPFDPALVSQESSLAPLLTAGTPFVGFNDVKINDQRRILVNASVDDPAIATTVDRALYVHQLDAAGAITSSTLVAVEGQIPPGQTQAIAEIATGPHDSAINGDGEAMYTLDLAGDTAVDFVIYHDNAIIAQEGSPSPAAGRDWLSLSTARMDLTGEHHVHTGTLAGDTASDLVIVKDGVIFRQEGGTLPAIGGVFTFSSFGSGPVEVSTAGDVLWFGDWNDPDTTRDTGLFLNDELLIQEGVTVIEGQTVLSLSAVEDGYHMSDDGSHVIVELTLADGTSGAFLMTLDDCPADIASNGSVDVNDLLAVITTWGPCPAPCPPNCTADIVANCTVDVNDLLAVITTWGPCP